MTARFNSTSSEPGLQFTPTLRRPAEEETLAGRSRPNGSRSRHVDDGVCHRDGRGVGNCPAVEGCHHRCWRTAPAVDIVIAASDNRVPTTVEPVPMTAPAGTYQKTFLDWAPPVNGIARKVFDFAGDLGCARDSGGKVAVRSENRRASRQLVVQSCK